MNETIQDHGSQGLRSDMERMLGLTLTRRKMLAYGSIGGAAFLTGCGGDGDSSSSTSSSSSSGTTTTTTTTTTSGSTVISTDGCTVINSETAGPYPADGSNTVSGSTVNALSLSGIVRSDIRSSISTGTTAAGIPLTIILKLVNVNNSCAALSGYAIYLWHCNRDGNYSLYSSGITNEDYLRGVQQTDSNGQVSFTSIFPACYSGRWPHIHFEIFSSLSNATAGSKSLKTSQLAMPQNACNEVYATTGYSKSITNLSQVSLSTDNVFGDDSAKYQLSSVTGNTTDGYIATLVVGVSV